MLPHLCLIGEEIVVIWMREIDEEEIAVLPSGALPWHFATFSA
jgi:hypothetical protein